MTASQPGHRPRRGFAPPAITVLLLVNIIFFLFEERAFSVLLNYLALWPPGERGPDFHLWQLVSYSFLHGDVAHLFFNMFALWMFGRHVEQQWGSARFLVYFFVCVVGAAMVQLLVIASGLHGHSAAPTIGASGGVFGILLAYGMMFPNQFVILIFPPIPIRARWFVVLYGGLELWLGVTGTGSKVAHFAHLGGMLFGLLLILYWQGRMPWKPREILRR